MKKVLFIDRDGTLIKEPSDYQVDSFQKLTFYPKVITFLGKIAKELDYELVMVTNQDGLGTDQYPEDKFWPIQQFVIETFKNEGVEFSNVCIDTTFASENAPTRKPNTGLLTSYVDGEYDLKNSYVIGDRFTDVELAKNLGSKAIFINTDETLAITETTVKQQELEACIALKTTSWEAIYSFLRLESRQVTIQRTTSETEITVSLLLDGTGKHEINTGLPFFNHMLEQLSKHGLLDLNIQVKGDLEVDEHHTIEDTMIVLGEAFSKALGSKLGIERYGFQLPMDDCLAQVSIDFGGRNWLVWEADFKREMIGNVPTEMFFHMFKSFSDAAKCNLNIKAEGINEHHKIEAIFKAFARAIKKAIKRDKEFMILPSTKGLL